MIVIGAGGGGAVIAKELAARGLDVLVLEAGTRFAHPESEWSHFSQDASNPVTGYFRWGPRDRSQPPYARERNPATMAILQIAGVGGTTLHYSGNCPRAMPGVFQDYRGTDRRNYDDRHLFPLAYEDLIPYYEWVEATLPVQTAPMGTKEQVFFEGARAAGLPLNRFKDVVRPSFRPQENAILQPGGTAGRSDRRRDAHFPRARGCTFCGHCLEGCFEPLGAPRNLKAKRSTDNSYIPMALTADRWHPGGRAITLLAGAFVDRVDFFTRGARATARGVSWVAEATGERFSEDARVVVLAAGAIESPRLWLNSGLPNPNGWVGRGMTNHFEDTVTGLMPFETGSTKGPTSAARADFPGHGSLQVAGVPPADTVELGAGGMIARREPRDITRSASRGRVIGLPLERFVSHIDRILSIAILTDDDVDPHNGVSLSGSLAPDAHGRVPRIDVVTRSRRSIGNREFLVREAGRILRRAGAEAIHRGDAPPILGHIHSTLRMGRHAPDSVLGPSGEARWVRRLFVADNSALANALGGPNPTLTTQALATRSAERIFGKYFDGEPWVRHETPIDSTDHRITRALRERGVA